MAAKDYYREKPESAPPNPSIVVPSATYLERGQRWMEKEEAYSLRQAMDDMDLKDEQRSPDNEDDKTLFDAAQNEASELVWQHLNGVKPPEPGTPYRYKPHLRKDSYAHARAASLTRQGSEVSATGLARDGARSASGSSSNSSGRASPENATQGNHDQPRKSSVESFRQSRTSGVPRSGTSNRRRSSMKRNISGEIQKPFSGDQIWEEPEGSSDTNPRLPKHPGSSQPLGTKTRGPLNTTMESTDAETAPVPADTKPLSRFDIHKNPPTQSRNPAYTSNSPFNRPRPNRDVPKKNGVEIRGDDIREATSMRLKDRSERLPTPSAVSDRPGRPIVSFDKSWKAPEEAATDSAPEESARVHPGLGQTRAGPSQDQPPAPVPVITVAPAIPASTPPSTAQQQQRQQRHRQEQPRGAAPGPPPIPSIHVDSGGSGGVPQVPSISISADDGPPAVPTIVTPPDDGNAPAAPAIPTITTPEDEPQGVARPSSSRPLPTPQGARRSMQPHPQGGHVPGGHWSRAPAPTGNRATATCHECRHPIEGRYIALRGVAERFHPSCFRCHTCGTGLEALEISPEPDAFRSERLARIQSRANGEALPENPGQTMAEDGDDRLRFYCHLDWHELFAPRCAHCTTPILGDHVVALGKHWHHGHFFCAECGDPFGKGATHIEKDGYAWCVGCQTKRTERRAPKCKGCRRPVVGNYVQALGGEWHDECFRCATCGGGFDDGQIFPVQRRSDDLMVVLCTGCRSAELKR